MIVLDIMLVIALFLALSFLFGVLGDCVRYERSKRKRNK